MKRIVLSFITLMFIASVNLFAQGWQPYQFSGDEKYEFRITYDEGSDMKTGLYGIEIKATNETDQNGEKLHEVIYTTRGKIPESELGEQTAFGMWGAYGMSLSFVFLNPMYAMLFQQMEFEVGEKMSFFGAGTAKVTGKETVGNREGYICKYYQKEDSGEVLIGEWTIDPDLAFPIKSIMYDDEEVVSKIELISYDKY